MRYERPYNMKHDLEPPDFEKDSLKTITHKMWSALNREFDKLWDHLNDLKTDHEIEKNQGSNTENIVSNLHDKHDTLDQKVDKLDNKVAKIDGKQVIMILMLIGGLGFLGTILGVMVSK